MKNVSKLHKSKLQGHKILADYYRKTLKFMRETGNIEIEKLQGAGGARPKRGDYVEARQTHAQKF